MTVKEAAEVLLALDDDYWTRCRLVALDNAIEDAQRSARRNGHKARVMAREGFRAAMRAVIEMEKAT